MTSEATTTAATYLPDGLPAPRITERDRPYWDAAREHRLVVQVCARCGMAQWPPEEICARCHAIEREWAPSRGIGRIFSWTRAWHPAHPTLKEHGPYLIVVVELEDFPVLMIGNLLGDPFQPVRTGTPVRAVFEDRTSGYSLVQWTIDPRPAAGEAAARALRGAGQHA